MVSRAAMLASAALIATPAAVRAQSAAVDVTQTAGYSSEDVAAAGTQIRGSGDLASGVRFLAEAAWGARSSRGSDVFGAAYPYANRVQVIEAFGEKMVERGPALVGVRAGRYRTPFGISSGSDQAYIGFLRPPLIRYDGYYALSNDFLEHGVDVVAGVPALTVEASVGTPADVGEARRRGGVDALGRVQGAWRSFIIGVSRIGTNPYQPAEFAQGRASFTGVDVRWMQSGVQVRGEWIAGRPFDGTRTTGGYVDAIVHRPRMGVVTAVFRAERVDYDAPAPFAVYAERYTGGARVRLPRGFAASIDVVHQPQNLSQRRPTALDIGVTYSLREFVARGFQPRDRGPEQAAPQDK